MHSLAYCRKRCISISVIRWGHARMPSHAYSCMGRRPRRPARNKTFPRVSSWAERGRRATERSRSFAKWSIRRAAGYGIEQNRAAGFENGFLNVCLALVIFLQQSQIDHDQMLLCASRRVANRSEIPSSSVLCTNSSGFAPFHFAAFCKICTPQNFDSVRSLCDLSPLRMTHGGYTAARWWNKKQESSTFLSNIGLQ